MKLARALIALCVAPLGSTFAPTPAEANEEGWDSLFNGADLSGWVAMNVAPETFSVRDGMIICTGVPTGVLRTERFYENFIMELEWRHMKAAGNSGLFIWSDAVPAPGVPFTRAVEVQILDHGYGNTDRYTTHGDVFPIHGATMKPHGPHRGMRSFPTEFRSRPSPEWNHYRVVASNGVVRLSVNGKEVSGGSDCSPRKGYICLEAEGSEIHFRNLRVKELPSTNPRPEEIARPDEGYVSLYTGLDLRHWKAGPDHIEHWQPQDWILHYDGQSTAEVEHLWSEKEFSDFILIVDWRLPAKPEPRLLPVVLPTGEYARDEGGAKKMVEAPYAGEGGVFLRGTEKALISITSNPVGSGDVHGYRVDENMPPEIRAAATPSARADLPPGRWNRFILTMKGDRLTVTLNGETVIEEAHLPGIPGHGPVALKHGGSPVQFANIFIRELE